ncbi:MAG: protease inhibitor I42 family protein [Methanofollis sp.]|uniref:protease inhibitor I42 family protein n=1 Tax=Methanofollis sp. TaxID=2052835 RepID=UPI00261EE287|nr:protease inhibitor I42 family protein [Methanofollis sp.]MDD4255570.1 protease inhibitor I42 family protein [Methanofollis sp.]
MVRNVILGALALLCCACILGAGCTTTGPAQTNTTTPVPVNTTAPVTPTETVIGMPNPAAAWCQEQGYTSETRKDAAGNEYGVCIFDNGTEADEWAVYRAATGAFNKTANGTAVNATVGDIVGISLTENPTTGYSWNTTLSAGLTLLNDTYTVDPHAEGMVGVGGTHLWLVRADAAGNQTFSAVYKRSWENTTGTEDTFSLTLKVA